MTDGAPIGILGGSFDPVHLGHLRLAADAKRELRLGSIRWMPSGTPGHREPARAGADDRLRMLQLALAAEPRCTIDETELRSPGRTYTVNTLQRLRSELGPAAPLVFLMGADQLLALDTWREWTTLFTLAHFGVAERPGYPVEVQRMGAALAGEFMVRRAEAAALAASPCGRIAVFAMRPTDVSSTAVRKALASGQRPAAVPAAVLDYIQSRHLYGT